MPSQPEDEDAQQANGRPRTIHDVARALGVSARTVSRVINGRPGVGPRTRERVEAYIAAEGYQPHHGARSLRSSAVDSIGVTLSAPSSVMPLSQELLSWLFSELYRVFGARGYFITFDLQGIAQQDRGDYGRGIWQRRFDATIIVGAFHEGDSVLERIHASGQPYAALARLYRLPQCNTATVDYEAGAYLSARLLLERGHKRIGMLQALNGYQPGTERRRGYLRAHEECGVEVDPALTRPVSFHRLDVVENTRRLLSDSQVTALIDCSGMQHADAIRDGAAQAGRKTNGDVEVVAWSYTHGAAVMAEAVAHVWLPVREASSEGLELLAAALDAGERPCFQVLHTPLVYTPSASGERPAPQQVFQVEP